MSDDGSPPPNAGRLGSTSRSFEAAALPAMAAAIVLAVGLIYRHAVRSYFFNDDFDWIATAPAFQPANLIDIGRYNHFYRPVIEIYFYLARSLFGCAALPFHLASLAIHLLNVALVFLFARAFSGSSWIAGLGALFLSVQPGYTEAVSWVAAITDLLPAVWYILTLWMFVRFLQERRAVHYRLALAAFSLCLLTHESSATLLLMMLMLEATLGARRDASSIMTRVIKYAPFALLLASDLAIAFVVNRRSYLITEGHYRLGWHAVPHALWYIIALYVGKRNVWSYAMIVCAVAALLARGTPRVRFFVAWILYRDVAAQVAYCVADVHVAEK